MEIHIPSTYIELQFQITYSAEQLLSLKKSAGRMLPGNRGLRNTVIDEFLFCNPLTTTTTGEDIFRLVDNFLKAKELSCSNCFPITTDGAPTILGSRRGCKTL